jgi:hypothetical protein
VYLAIGPNLGYWLGGNGNIDDLSSTAVPTYYKVHFGDAGDPDDLQISLPNRLQLGLVFGLGKLFELEGDRMLSVEARYEMGHSFLGSEAGVIEALEYEDNLESKHQLISLNVGYFWVLHKKSKRRRSSTYKAKQRAG